MLFAVLLAAGLCLEAAPVQGVEPGEVLQDAGLEARARALSAELRCVVCQNQSIDDSDAPLARDLRRLVRERLKAGDTDDAVKAYIVARYGTFVLLRPPLTPNTLLLWLFPFVIFVVALVVVYRGVFRRDPAPDGEVAGREDLSDDEQRRLDAVLKPTQKDTS